MKERRRHQRPALVISMAQAANANAWNEFSKDQDRWAKVEAWPRQFDPKKKAKK